MQKNMGVWRFAAVIGLSLMLLTTGCALFKPKQVNFYLLDRDELIVVGAGETRTFPLSVDAEGNDVGWHCMTENYAELQMNARFK